MTVVDLYTLQFLNDVEGDTYHPGLASIMGANVVRQILEEAEENLTDLLPAGYRARIRRWDHAEPEEGDDVVA